MSKNKNKREKKGYLEFFIVILISALFGGVGAVILEIYDKDVKSIGNLLEDVIGQGAFWVICFLSVVGSLVNIYMVWAVRKRCRTWDGEDDEAAEEIERYNSRCQGVIACCTTIVMVLSGVNIVYIFHRTENMRNIGIMCILFVSYSLWSAFAQNILVEFSKIMNPEKKGNALSLHFTRDWDNSCDEQEKARMYRAAYVVYRKSNWLYSGIFIFLLMLSVVVDIGVLPFLMLGIIWTYQNVLYICNYNKKCK